MAKRSSSGIPSPPKPPKLTLPKPQARPSAPSQRSLKQAKLRARPYQPKPAKLGAPKFAVPHPRTRPQPPKSRRMDFPKPYTSDSLTTIPQFAVPNMRTAAKSSELLKQKKVAPKVVEIAKAPEPVKAVAISTILWTSAYPALRETAKLMIEAEGFTVHSASDFLQVEVACREDLFQLAVVDHTLSPKIKRAIAAVIREKCAGTYILELCQVSSEIPDADYLLIGSEPEALVRMVKRIARERNR